MPRDERRRLEGAAVAVACALLWSAALHGCSREPRSLAWRQHDLWVAASETERDTWGTLQGRALRTLPARPEAPLVFELALGAGPWLSFRPIVASEDTCRFAVAFAEPGDPFQSLYRAVHEPLGATLPDEVAVDLGTWANATGTLRLTVEPSEGGRCAGHWGSPRVVDRSPVARPSGPASPPHVLLIAADTLRTDALGAWGGSPGMTPNLDRLADESQVWLHAFATANNTNPSLASLMTGLYPKDHGLFDLRTRLPDARVTLAEHLRGAGYATAAIVAAAHLKNSGLDQGFERFVRPGGQFFAETVVDMAIDWLQRAPEQPTFLWLHFFDPHVPHNPPWSYAQGLAPARAGGMAPVDEWKPFREVGPVEFDPRSPRGAPGHRLLYPGEVAYLDREIGRLVDFLRSRGRLDRTVLAFVADHGETLGERGSWFRHQGLYDETTHVPLMIRWPGGSPRGRIEDLVQHFDLFPTLLAAAGGSADVDARPLQPGTARDGVFASHANDTGHMLRTMRRLLIFERATRTRPRRSLLYDLEHDPAEQSDISGRGDDAEAALSDRLGSWRATKRHRLPAERVEIDAAEGLRLRALGYGD